MRALRLAAGALVEARPSGVQPLAVEQLSLDREDILHSLALPEQIPAWPVV